MLILHKNCKILKNQKGITVLEIVGSVGLFAIGITALLGVYTQAVTMAKRADYAYVAYNLAKNRVERLRELDFASLPVANESSVRINRSGDPDPAGEFIRSTAVAASYGGDANLTRVDVQVFYEMRGVLSPTSMDVTTVIFNG